MRFSDRAFADDAILSHQAGKLPGCDSARGPVELEFEGSVGLDVHPARYRLRVIAKANGLDLVGRAVKGGVLQAHAVGVERLPRADDYAVRLGFALQDVQRLWGCELQAAPLAHRVVVLALMAAEDVAAAIDDVTGRSEPRAAVPLQEGPA